MKYFSNYFLSYMKKGGTLQKRPFIIPPPIIRLRNEQIIHFNGNLIIAGTEAKRRFIIGKCTVSKLHSLTMFYLNCLFLIET